MKLLVVYWFCPLMKRSFFYGPETTAMYDGQDPHGL